MYSLDEVRNVDPQIADAIVEEQERQNSHIELIASENWVSKAVMAAMGSPLTNKYAEGYPAKRYYGGCECVDVWKILQLSVRRSCLAVTMQMCSRIRARRQIWQFSSRCLSRVTRLWA